MKTTIQSFVQFFEKKTLQSYFAFALLLCSPWIHIHLRWLAHIVLCLSILQSDIVKSQGFLLLTLLAYGIELSNTPLLPFPIAIFVILQLVLLSKIQKQFCSWAITIEYTMFNAIFFIAVLHLLLPNLYLEWLKLLQQTLVTQHIPSPPDPSEALSALKLLSYYMTGMQLLFPSLYCLLIIRFCEYLNQDKATILELNCSSIASVIMLCTIIGVLLNWNYPKDILAMVIFPFFLIGLSQIHTGLQKEEHKTLILICFYSAMVALPFLMLGAISLLAFYKSFTSVNDQHIK
jgi:hypothetical protein